MKQGTALFKSVCLHETGYCFIKTGYCLVEIASCFDKTGYCLVEIASCFNKTGYCLVETGYCFNKTGYCFVEIRYHFIITEYCFDETGYCFSEIGYCFNEKGYYSIWFGQTHSVPYLDWMIGYLVYLLSLAGYSMRGGGDLSSPFAFYDEVNCHFCSILLAFWGTI